MYRLKVVTIFVFLLLCQVSCQQPAVSVANTYWRYTDDDISYEVLFQPDGHVYSYHPSDVTPENDFWKQRGKRVSFTMNDHYATYKGKLVNDSTLTGKGSSKGFRWKWTAKFVTTH